MQVCSAGSHPYAFENLLLSYPVSHTRAPTLPQEMRVEDWILVSSFPSARPPERSVAQTDPGSEEGTDVSWHRVSALCEGGTIPPLPHTPDLAVAFTPKAQRASGPSSVFLIILLDRDDLLACAVLEISSAQDTRRLWCQPQQNPYSVLEQLPSVWEA